EAIYDDGGAGVRAAFGVGEVARVEHVPAAVRVFEGMRVYREAVLLAVRELHARVFVRPLGPLTRGDAQLELLLLLATHRVVEVEGAALVGDLRRPELVSPVCGRLRE